LNTFISGKREGGADSFELKLAYDIEKSKLDAKYADPETNSVLQNLRERADALSDRTDDISGLAGTYPDTAALEADYQNLMNRYPNIFPTLPARGPNRQAALERALDFIGR